MSDHDLASVTKMVECNLFTPMGNVFSSDKAKQQWGVPTMAVSDPGKAKTALIRQLAARMQFKQDNGSYAPIGLLSFEPGSVGEAGFGVTPVPIKEKGHGEEKDHLGLAFPPLVDFIKTFGGTQSRTPGILFIDEASTARGQQLDALLTAIQYGKIGTFHLNPRVRRLGAMNPSDQTAGNEIIPVAVCNRMCWLNWPGPSLDEFISHMATGGNMTVDEEDLIDVDAREAEILSVWNNGDNWPAAVASIGGWLKAMPEFLHDMPDLNSEAAAGPWASARSNEYAMRILCASKINGLSEEQRNTLIFGVLGAKAGSSWYQWHKEADLPSIDDFLDGKQKFKHSVQRLDRTNAVLAGCRARLKDPKCPNRNERAKTMWKFMDKVSDDASDLLAPAVNDMYNAKLIAMKEARPVLAKMHDVIGVTKRR